MLHLTNGGHVAGRLLDSDKPGRIRWQGHAFTAPFEFFTDAVNAVHFPPPAEAPRAGGESCFELAGGSVLFGTLSDLDGERAVIDSPRFGPLHVHRRNLLRITRWGDGAQAVFLGPIGLSGWREPDPKDGWREEAGQLLSDKENAAVRGEFALPAKAVVEFELSWSKQPDFVLALGAGDTPESLAYAYRFEVWDDKLIARSETANQGDVAEVGTIESGEGRAHLLAYLDQDEGRMLVFTPAGKKVGDIALGEKKHQVLPGVTLVNKRGDLRLERLRITRWGGEPPPESQGDRIGIRRIDGTFVPGEVARFDRASHQYVILKDGRETGVAADQCAALILSARVAHDPRAFRAACHDGSLLGGELLKVEKGDVWMTVRGVEEPVRVRAGDLRSLVAPRPATQAVANLDFPTGTLEAEGTRLPGVLVDGTADADASCLVWQPRWSAAPSSLKTGTSGRIVYKEKPAPKPQPAFTGAEQRVRVLNRAGAIGMQTTPARAPEPTLPLGLHLRTGDTIPCTVTRIDEEGVWFRSPQSEGKFVPHAKVQAVELARLQVPLVRLTKSKRERLLTLPRMQKDSPPTHLIQSRNGDYLRGRVLAMDDSTLRVEVRLETKDVPRDRIARIIWLHADEKASQPAKPEGPAAGTRVQTVRNDGSRLTFQADRVADGVISGKSDVLGPCRASLKEVDQILFGAAIEREASQLAYGRWTLHDAPIPKAFEETGESAGTQSPLVGKPAPDFTLDLLDGKSFRLSEHKGKVLVLDFWATWCGPCIRAMPQVEQVAGEFAEKGVQLVAVNLEESPKPIKAMLDRHKLNVTVALDRDGAVAGKYGANAIPQTVVIDREGNVSRLFVGGGPRLDEQLREALKAALAK